ncbi:MAG: hypothetical protein V1835_03920 [Candidatus Micrarchaeota archaeon]
MKDIIPRKENGEDSTEGVARITDKGNVEKVPLDYYTNRQVEEKHAKLGELIREDRYPFRVAYHHFTIFQGRGAPVSHKRQIIIDTLALHSSHLKSLPAQLLNIVREVDAPFADRGKLTRIDLMDTWMLNDPRYFKYFQTEAGKLGYSLHSEKKPLRNRGYVWLVRKALEGIEGRLKEDPQKRDIPKNVELIINRLRSAAKERNTKKITIAISEMTKRTEPELVQLIMPELFRKYHLRPTG